MFKLKKMIINTKKLLFDFEKKKISRGIKNLYSETIRLIYV